MPRYYDNGCFFTVQLSESDVIEWTQSWPCFGPRRSIWFQFDKRNGDLVDMKECPNNDESGILALSADAQKWGELCMQGERVQFRAEMGVAE